MEILNNNEQPSDEQIVARIQKGSPELFGEIVSRYETKISRYVRRFLAVQGDVEDVVQDTFIKAYRNIKSFDPDRKFSSWIYRIAHNESINFLKKRKVESMPLLDFDVLFPHLAKEEHETEKNRTEIKELVEQSLGKLDAKYREPLILYYIEGFNYKEIAEILRIPAATVGVRLNRAKKMLKENYHG